MSVVAVHDFDESELLRLAASVEQASEHPLAAAIVAGAEKRGLTVPKAQHFESVTGKGVYGAAEGRRVTLGNRAMLEELRIDAAELAGFAENMRASAQTVIFVIVDGKQIGRAHV